MNRNDMNHSVILSYNTDNVRDFLYFDISDQQILHAFTKECNEEIFIGIDHQFIKAVNDCLQWHLYDLTYAINDCFTVKENLSTPTYTLSAIGLLKRIVSNNKFKRISFLFKNHEQIQLEGMKAFSNIIASSISINLTSFTEADLQSFSTLLKETFQSMLETDQTENHIVVKLVSVPLIDRRLVIECMVDILHEIQSKMMVEKKLNILMRKKMSPSIYALCHIEQYEPAEQLMEYDHQSIMDHMTKAWEDNSLMLTI